MQAITHYPERVFYERVICAAIAPEAHSAVQHQHPVHLGGRTRKIDFALIGTHCRLALELDGYTYHAEGQISQSDFSDQLERQNSLILEGWTILRFSWDDVLSRPDYCVNTLRRALVDDPLFHPFLGARELRPHLIQTEALAALKTSRLDGHTRALVVLPTGMGKTYLAAFDARSVGGRVLFVVHNNEILEQAANAFAAVFPDAQIGYFHGTVKEPDADIVCGNVFSLHTNALRRHFAPDAFDYIVIDEFHHSAAYSYQPIREYFAPRFLLGLTATPSRTDKQDILEYLDNHIAYSLDTPSAIERGLLVPFQYYAFRDDIDYSTIRHNGFRYSVNDLNRLLIIEQRDEAILEKYLSHGHSKAIGFCVSIEHAERMAAFFSDRGIPAVAVHSKLRKQERAERVAGFRAGKVTVVFVRDVFNEGVDFPDVQTLMFLRPTESRIIFIQQLGRGLRLAPEKQSVTVLDFIGNYQGAANIFQYLEDSGAPNTETARGNKPVLHFDNGCIVSFEIEAIEAIDSIGRGLIRDIDVVKSVFQWAGHHERMPSFCDLLLSQDVEISDVYSVYGSWREFIARLLAIDESWDYEPLTLPDSVSTLDRSGVLQLLDRDRGFLENTLQQVLEGSAALLAVLLDLTDTSIRGTKSKSREEKIWDMIEAVAKESRGVVGDVRAAVFTLSFHYDANAAAEWTQQHVASLLRNLNDATFFRDTNRAAMEADRCIQWLAEVCQTQHISERDDGGWFQLLLRGHNELTSLNETFCEIVASE